MKHHTHFIICILLITSVTAQTLDGGAGVEPGTGTNPQIMYAWVLPDESADQGVQLDLTPGQERNDIFACIIVGDEDGRDTIEDVFIDMYHPDGSKKYQVHASWLDQADEGGSLEIHECIDGGVDSGSLTSQDKQDIEYWVFSQQAWYAYKVYLPMYYHQPAGIYTGKVYATDSQSQLSDPLDTTFEWLPATYLETDFTSVDFGDIQAGEGVYKMVHGDMNMSTSDAPTLRNQGNTEVFVGLEFSPFVGRNYSKVIDDFDAQLRSMNSNYNNESGEHIYFNASEKVEFSTPISLCRTEKIDFSIHAGQGIVPDEYEGTLQIFARPNIVDSPPVDATFPVLNQDTDEIGQGSGNSSVNTTDSSV